MALLGKDWNIVAVTFERSDLFRINGNRGKGGDATKIRDNARRHSRTLYWAVFDQKGRMLEGEPGAGHESISKAVLERLVKEAPTNESIKSVVSTLQKGESKAARVWSWDNPLPGETTATAAATEEAPEQTSHYTLVVVAEDGDELETTITLTQQGGRVQGVLIAPDGSEAPLDRARLIGSELSFEFTLDPKGEAIKLKFQGQVSRDVIRGQFI